ncbi:MAG: FHA domain-containing protein [Acidimicrobiales bacterium]
MTVTCPAGHESATDDYCDVCGAVILAPGPPSPAAAAPEAEPTGAGSGPACANCGAPHEQGDAFCEVCGLDFATGELPQPPPPPEAVDPDAGAEVEPVEGAEAEAPSEPQASPAPAAAAAAAPAPGDWFVVIEPDHDWFERNEAEGTTGSVPFPDDTSPWQLTLTGDEVLVGRRSDTRTAQPDLEIDDPGVSRRHAVLRRQPDATWVIVDEHSTNGTWVDGAADPIVAGETAPLADGATVHIGAFTRLTIHRA